MASTTCRPLLLLGVGCALLLAPAASASGHTPLVGSTPTAQGRVDAAPTHVVLEFDRPVAAGDHDVLVLDAAGAQRVRDVLVSDSGRAVSVLLEPGGSAGTWSVRYDVLGDDGHVVGGGFPFAVGADAASSLATWRPVAASGMGAATVLGAFLMLLRRLDRCEAR